MMPNEYTHNCAPEFRHQLRGLRKKCRDMQTDLRHLRRQAQINAQQQRQALKDAFERIKVILNTNVSWKSKEFDRKI